MIRRQLVEGIAVAAMVVLTAGWRFYRLDYPTVFKFDEVYHVPTSDLIAHGDPRAYEWWHGELTQEYGAGTYVDWLHPPLVKLLQAASLKIIGFNPWGWRVPSALAGTLLVLVVYAWARDVFPDRPGPALGSAFLAAVDGLAIAQSQIAMNDIFVTLAVALALWAYGRYHHFFADTPGGIPTSGKTKFWDTPGGIGLWTGLAIASKWSGWWLFGVYFTGELYQVLTHRQHWRRAVGTGLVIVGGAAAVYFGSYTQMFAQGKDLGHWWQLHRQILTYQFHLRDTHPYASSAIQWPWGGSAVLLYVDPETGQQVWNKPFYPTWFLSVGCWVVALAGEVYGLTRPAGSRQFLDRDRLGRWGYLLVSHWWLWAPWIFSPRIMFFHHYLPALPALWVLSGGVLDWLLTACPGKLTGQSESGCGIIEESHQTGSIV